MTHLTVLYTSRYVNKIIYIFIKIFVIYFHDYLCYQNFFNRLPQKQELHRVLKACTRISHSVLGNTTARKRQAAALSLSMF